MKKTNPTTKLMFRMFRRISAAVCGAALLAGVQSVTAQSIGCYFVTNNAGGIIAPGSEADSMATSDSAGAPPYAQTYWNSLSQSSSSGTYSLTDSTGASHSLAVQWSSWATTGQGTLSLGTPDGKLFNTGLSTWNPGAASPLGNSCGNSSGNNQPLVYIGGLNAWWTSIAGAEGYRVSLYTCGDTYWENVEGYVESVSGNPLANTMVEGTSLVPHLFEVNNATYSGTYVPATGTTSGSATGGANYMPLGGMTNDAILLRLQTSGYGQGLDGFQLIPIFPTQPAASAPTFSPSATVYGGTPVTLTEVATGDLIYTNLWFQWVRDVNSSAIVTNIIANATNSTYAFTPPNLGVSYTINFDVIVTNIFGAVTSSVVTLNVQVGPPYVTTDTSPGQGDGSTNVYAFANGSVTFNAAFSGTAPIADQWQVDKGSGYTGILNDTNGSVTLTNLQSSDNGNYRVVASNVAGSGNSTPSPLTVLADPAAPSPAQPYAYTVFTNNPVAYWRFSETSIDVTTNSMQAYDYSGHNLDATYGHGTAIFDNGLNSSSFPGFESVNPSVSLVNGLSGSSLTVPPLNLNTNTATISMWINPNAVVGTYWGLLTWGNTTNGDKAGFGFGGTQSNSVAALGYTWNSNSPATWGFNSGLYPPTGQWSFVSLVITPTNSTIYLYYTDGSGTHVSKAVQAISNSPEAFGGSGGTIWIGSDGYSGRNFDGYIDEVSVFNKSLSEAQIQNLFKVGSGAANVAPFITADISPTNVNTYAGITLTMTANGDGMPGPTFQWQAGTGGVFNNVVNGSGVSGANSSTLTIASPAPTSNLNYRLLLSNTSGSATSSICPVTLSPVPTNGLWTACYQVTNSDNGVGYVHASGSYTGQGVLGHGGFWNVIPGAGLYGYSSSNYTSASDYQDNGATHSGITCSILGYAQSWVVGQASPANAPAGLLSQFVSFVNTTNTITNAIAFSGVPSGTYNLAFHGINVDDRNAKIRWEDE